MNVHFRDGDASPGQARILLGMSSLEADTLQTDHSTSQPTACLSAWLSCQPAELLRCLAALYPNDIFICPSLQLFFFSSRTSFIKFNALCSSSDHLQKHKAKALFPLSGSSLGSDYSFSPQVGLADLHPFQGRPAQAPSAFANFGTKHKEAQHRHKSFYL